MSAIANVRELSFIDRLLSFFPTDKPEEVSVSEDGQSITVRHYFQSNGDLLRSQFNVFHVAGDQYVKLDDVRDIDNDNKPDIQFQICSSNSPCQTFWMSNDRVNEKIDEAINSRQSTLTEVRHDPTEPRF